MSWGLWENIFYAISVVLMLMIIFWPKPPKLLVAATFMVCGFVGYLILRELWWGLAAWGVGLVYFWLLLRDSSKTTKESDEVATHKRRI